MRWAHSQRNKCSHNWITGKPSKRWLQITNPWTTSPRKGLIIKHRWAIVIKTRRPRICSKTITWARIRRRMTSSKRDRICPRERPAADATLPPPSQWTTATSLRTPWTRISPTYSIPTLKRCLEKSLIRDIQDKMSGLTNRMPSKGGRAISNLIISWAGIPAIWNRFTKTPKCSTTIYWTDKTPRIVTMTIQKDSYNTH